MRISTLVTQAEKTIRSARTVAAGLTVACLASCLLSGCGYVHFGRLPTGARDTAAMNDATELRIEKKILQQELAIARRENDALRNALNDRQAAPSITEPAGRLAMALREISALRATVTHLNTELLAHKEARMKAEQKLAAIQTQMVQEAQRPAPTVNLGMLSTLRERSASSVSELDLARLRNAGLSATETPTQGLTKR